jgi:dynein light intermediate chain 1, cytosolic
MVGIGQRLSGFGQNSGAKVDGGGSRPTSKDGNKKNIWSSMLDSVASGKRLPEKNMLVLGTGIPISLRTVTIELGAVISSGAETLPAL